ncbi:MAG: ArsR/SmtB family transcription factor [Planctomycetaceae bacterium]
MAKHDTLEPDRCAKLLAALATPERLRIVRVLAPGPRHVTDIATILGLPVVNVSHHLKVLEASGLIAGRKEGRFVRYALCEGVLERLPAAADDDCSEAINLGCCKILVPLEASPPKRAARKPS